MSILLSGLAGDTTTELSWADTSGGGAIPGLWIDWDYDGFGSGDNDDCTSLLIRAQYNRGSTPEITGAAQAGQGIFTLKNPGGLFDPDYAAGPLFGKLHDGVPVWFGAREDGTIDGASTAPVRGRFAGRITEIAPLPMAGAGDSTPTVEIICEDALGWYGRTPVALTQDCSPIIPGTVGCVQSATGFGENSAAPVVLPGGAPTPGQAIWFMASNIAVADPHRPDLTTIPFTKTFRFARGAGYLLIVAFGYRICDGTEGDTLIFDNYGAGGTNNAPFVYVCELNVGTTPTLVTDGLTTVPPPTPEAGPILTTNPFPLSPITVTHSGYLVTAVSVSSQSGSMNCPTTGDFIRMLNVTPSAAVVDAQEPYNHGYVGWTQPFFLAHLAIGGAGTYSITGDYCPYYLPPDTNPRFCAIQAFFPAP